LKKRDADRKRSFSSSYSIDLDGISKREAPFRSHSFILSRGRYNLSQASC